MVKNHSQVLFVTKCYVTGEGLLVVVRFSLWKPLSGRGIEVPSFGRRVRPLQ